MYDILKIEYITLNFYKIDIQYFKIFYEKKILSTKFSKLLKYIL